MDEQRTEKFLDLYKRLETAIRKKYDVPNNVGAVMWLCENDNAVKRIKTELIYCARVRNLLAHYPRVKGEYAVVPSDAMIETLRLTIKTVEQLPDASDLGTSKTNIFTAKYSDLILPVMKEMVRRSYSYVPIVDAGHIVGVFSESTIFTYLVENDIVGFDEGDDFTLLADYLPLEKHETETFAFVAADDSAQMVTEVFYEALKKTERLGAVFVTAHGHKQEPLLGMITPWDMAAYL